MSRFDLSDVEQHPMKSDTDVVRDILDRNRARIGDVSASLAGLEGAPELDPIGRVLVLAAVADLRCAETRLEEVLERLRGDARAESADPYPEGSNGKHEKLDESDTP